MGRAFEVKNLSHMQNLNTLSVPRLKRRIAMLTSLYRKPGLPPHMRTRICYRLDATLAALRRANGMAF